MNKISSADVITQTTITGYGLNLFPFNFKWKLFFSINGRDLLIFQDVRPVSTFVRATIPYSTVYELNKSWGPSRLCVGLLTCRAQPSFPFRLKTLRSPLRSEKLRRVSSFEWSASRLALNYGEFNPSAPSNG